MSSQWETTTTAMDIVWTQTNTANFNYKYKIK